MHYTFISRMQWVFSVPWWGREPGFLTLVSMVGGGQKRAAPADMQPSSHPQIFFLLPGLLGTLANPAESSSPFATN